MGNKVNKFFDFITDENGMPIVRTFQAEERPDKFGRTHLVQTSDFVLGHSYDMEETIAALRYNDYYSWDQTLELPLNVRTNNPMVALKLILLSNNCALLNKVYNDKAVVDGMHCITTYINYVDVGTGKQYVMCVGVDYYSPELINELENDGFGSIEGTVLMDSINSLRDDCEAVEIKPELMRKR